MRKERHNMRFTGVYEVWKAMKQRCLNPRNKDYAHYGARGITVCERWQKSFTAFYCDMGDRPDKHTLERIDNEGNYEPGNCKWATWHDQRINTRPRIIPGGRKTTPEHVAQILGLRRAGLNYKQISERIGIVSSVQCRNICIGKVKSNKEFLCV